PARASEDVGRERGPKRIEEQGRLNRNVADAGGQILGLAGAQVERGLYRRARRYPGAKLSAREPLPAGRNAVVVVHRPQAQAQPESLRRAWRCEARDQRYG